MDIIEYLNTQDRFAAHCGATLISATADTASVRMTVGKEHLNAAGVCQGGAVFTLADLAMAAVMNNGEFITLTTSCTVEYLHSAVEGDVLTATASCEGVTTRLPHCLTRVCNQDGVLIAVMSGRGYRKKDRITF